MYENWTANFSVVGGTLVAVAASVLLHYEGLIVLSRVLSRHGGHARVKVLYAIGSIIGLHVLEIWLFACMLWLLLLVPGAGSLAGQAVLHFFDLVYLSAVTFSTVGYGDITPVGAIRFLSGTEALTGFVLITWSASFTYLEMERSWRNP